MIYSRQVVLDASGGIASLSRRLSSWAATMLVMTILFAPEASTSWANATTNDSSSHRTNAVGVDHHCSTAEDLDFEGCKPENLPIQELKSICDGVGLNTEKDVFPFLFSSSSSSSSSSDHQASVSASVLPATPLQGTDRFTQEDYAAAAYECILVSEETNSHFDEGFIAEVLEESSDVLVHIVTDVMELNPGLIEELIKELKEDEPSVWEAIEQETTADGQSLLDKPEVVSELVKALLHHHADLFEVDDTDWDDDEDDDDDDDDEYDDDEEHDEPEL